MLPLVISTTDCPVDNSPRCSAASIMASAIRSFLEWPGLRYSSFAKIRPRGGPTRRDSSTKGVCPIAPSTEGNTCCAAVSFMALNPPLLRKYYLSLNLHPVRACGLRFEPGNSTKRWNFSSSPVRIRRVQYSIFVGSVCCCYPKWQLLRSQCFKKRRWQ